MKIVKTEVVEIIIRPDNILEVHTRKDWQGVDTPENAREVALALKDICSQGDYAILSFPPNLYIEREILEAYLNVKIGQVAQAAIIKTFGTRLLVKIASQFFKAPYPSENFSNRADAERWLHQQLEQYRKNNPS